MADFAYFNLTLDTTAPVLPEVLLGTNGFVNSLSTPITVSWEEDDVKYVKIWGVIGKKTISLTGDGETSTFTLTPIPSSISSVEISSVATTSYTFDSSTGVITFDAAPEDGASIAVSYEDLLTEATASWKEVDSATSKTLVESVTLSGGDGAKTVYVQLRDDVYNASEVKEVTVQLDLSAPVVTIVSGPTPAKISKVLEKSETQFSFQTAEPFVEYFVAVVSGIDVVHSIAVNTMIGEEFGSSNMSGTGEFPAETSITCIINGADLEAASPGDGSKTIKVFVKDKSGNWSL